MTTTTAKQQLASVQAELSERRSLAAVNIQRRQGLENSISRLIAEQQLDGLDHSQRIAKAREELAEVSSWLKTWPDVERELNQRIEVAQEAAQVEWQADMVDRLAGVMAAEKALRLAHAVKNWEFQNLCLELRKVLALKDAFLNTTFEQGLPLRAHAGTCEMPHIPRYQGTEEGVGWARELYREWTGEDPESKVTE